METTKVFIHITNDINLKNITCNIKYIPHKYDRFSLTEKTDLFLKWSIHYLTTLNVITKSKFLLMKSGSDVIRKTDFYWLPHEFINNI